MAVTPQSQLTMRNCMELIVHLMPKLFGVRMQRGNIDFFGWLLVQSKILTADNLMARHWPCNTVCALCDQEPETGAHLCLYCSFAKQVWLLVSNWTLGIIQVPADQDEGLEDWWTRSLEMLPLVQQRSVAAIQLYTTWNIWKERNRRIFDQKSLQPPQVFQLIREEVNLRRVACGTPVVS